MAPTPTSHVATLVSDPARPVLTDAILAAARTLLPGAGAPVWLAQGIAADIPFTAANAALRALADQVRPRLGVPVDVVIQPAQGRRRKLYLTDMDSTVIEQECIDELADFAGLKEHVAKITERAMNGEIAFEPALRERVALLTGLEEAVIETCLTERIAPMPGARTLVATLKHHGCKTVLVTGGFHHFADPVAEDIGFERVVGNRLAVADGRLAGELAGVITDSAVKAQVLRDEMARLGENAASLATGDGANDIPMLQAATYGVAYRAKPKAREAANGWIDRGDLTNLLKLLEIPEHDWVAG